jgi:hypothetical protein
MESSGAILRRGGYGLMEMSQRSAACPDSLRANGAPALLVAGNILHRFHNPISQWLFPKVFAVTPLHQGRRCLRS